MDKRIKQQIEFILEVDKLKNVIRRNYLVDDTRRENTAEHSWHAILMALVLFEYAENKQQLDLLRIVKMLAIHDIVEIEAGDTFIFDTKGNKDKFNRENQAAKKLFTKLPYDQGKEYYDLWLEFEKEETHDSIYAASVDKIMPVLLNTYSTGISWREADVTSEMVFETLKGIKKGPRKLQELLEDIVKTAKEKEILS